MELLNLGNTSDGAALAKDLHSDGFLAGTQVLAVDGNQAVVALLVLNAIVVTQGHAIVALAARNSEAQAILDERSTLVLESLDGLVVQPAGAEQTSQADVSVALAI